MTAAIQRRMASLKPLLSSRNKAVAARARRQYEQLRARLDEKQERSSGIVSAEKIVGPIERDIRLRLQAIERSVAPALARLQAAQSLSDSGSICVRILALTYPGTLAELAGVTCFRDWQHGIWNGTTDYNLARTETIARRLTISVELVEDAIAEAHTITPAGSVA